MKSEGEERRRYMKRIMENEIRPKIEREEKVE